MSTSPNNVILFPAMRVRSIRPVPQPAAVPPGLLVDHDGRLYSIRALLALLPPALLADIAEAVPHSAQEAWDLCCRRWPNVAAEIAASVIPVDERSA